MAEQDGKEKTEQPTGKKLDDARNKGQVAKSREVNSLVVFSTGFMMLYLFQGFIGSRLKDFTISIFDSLDTLPNRISLITTFAADWYYFFRNHSCTRNDRSSYHDFCFKHCTGGN